MSMPQLHIVSGPSHGYYYFEADIKKRLQQGRQDWLAFLPVNRAVRLFQRRLIDAAPGNVLADPPLFTFDSFLLRIYRSLPQARTIIVREHLHFLVGEILRRHAAELHYLPASSNPSRNLVYRLSEMVGELRRFGFSAASLSRENAEEIGVDQDKLADFIFVLRAMEDILGDRYIDADSALYEAARRLQREQIENHFPGLNTVFIAGYGLFTPAMIESVEKLRNWYDVQLKLDCVEENGELFSHTLPALERFRGMGAEETKPNPTALARKLFNRKRKSEPFEASSKFFLLPAENRRGEVQRMARLVRRLHEDGRPLKEIALTFSNLEIYVPHIRRIFEDYGIPYNLSTGYALSQSPLIGLFVRLLDAVRENLEYGRVMQLYQSPFLKRNKPLADDLLFREVITRRVRHLNPGWIEQLLKAHITAEGENSNKLSALQRSAGQLEQFMQPLYVFGRQSRNADSFREDFLRLLRGTGALEWYKAEAPGLSEREQEREFRAYNRFMKLLDQFFWSMRLLHGETKLDVADWINHLQAAVARATYNLTEWPQDAVQIMPRLEILAVEHSVQIIGGLVDGDFPRGSAADLFFDDRARAQLGLLASEELLEQDRFMFYSLLDGGAQQVYLSFPAYEGEKALVPSTFLDDLRECCTISEVAGEDEQPARSFLELQVEFGEAVLNHSGQKAGKALAMMAGSPGFAKNIPDLLRRMRAGQQRLAYGAEAGVYEGVLSGNDKIKQDLAETFADKAWSITRLEEYAFCPMQFFMKRVLRLKEWPEFEEEVSPMERGNVVHRILFRFYSKLRDSGRAFNPEAGLEDLEAIAREELQKLPFEGFFWELEKSRFFGYDNTPGLLQTLVKLDSEEISKTEYVPSYFEFCFGHRYDDEVDPASVDQDLELSDGTTTLKVNGKVDRIDIDDNKKQALIFDYKTGNISGKTAKTIAAGLSFQLPLYALAVEQLLGRNVSVVYGGYFQVKDSENCKRKEAIVDRNSFSGVSGQAALPNGQVKIDGNAVSFDELVEFSKQQALQARANMEQGIFRHTQFPDKNECSSYCDFRRMCQKNVSKLLYLRKAQNDEEEEEN